LAKDIIIIEEEEKKGTVNENENFIKKPFQEIISQSTNKNKEEYPQNSSKL